MAVLPGNLAKAGLFPIVLRITLGRNGTDIFAGLKCESSTWDIELQRVSGRDKTATIINRNLEDILHRCDEKYRLNNTK